MRFIGNVIWLILVGLWLAAAWFVLGIVWCCTIIGIPLGVQCFKFAGLSLTPFGREVVFHGGGGSVLLNILWLLFGGIELAIAAGACGLVLCLTIIGIPFGRQCFKHAQLALMPFGSTVY